VVASSSPEEVRTWLGYSSCCILVHSRTRRRKIKKAFRRATFIADRLAPARGRTLHREAAGRPVGCGRVSSDCPAIIGSDGFAFSASTLLVRRQEERPARKA